VINDGEQGRVDYTVYIKDRLTGFDGESIPLCVSRPHESAVDAFVDTGFVLQLDCPDLALSRHAIFAHVPPGRISPNHCHACEALSDAVRDIPPDHMRMNICWASTMGPHHTDVPLKDIGEIRFVEVRVCADY
jgi:hypothetical protein